MFCFGFQSIARYINMNASYFTHIGWRVKETFPETLSVGKKIKLLFTDLGRSVLGETAREVLKTSGTVSPNTDLPACE